MIFLLQSSAMGWQGPWIGVRSAAKAFISAPADADLFDMRINPSILASFSEATFSIFSCRPYGLRELEIFSLAAAWKWRTNRLGIVLSRFGRTLFQNDAAELAFASHWGKRFFWGIKLCGERISIRRYGQRNRLLMVLGWHFRSGSRLMFHGTVHQGISGTFHQRDGRFLSLTAGATFQVASGTWLFLETAKESDFAPEYRLALSSRAGRWMRLRAGFSRNPERFCAGITLFLNLADFDYSTVFHPILGYTHVWGLTFHF